MLWICAADAGEREDLQSLIPVLSVRYDCELVVARERAVRTSWGQVLTIPPVVLNVTQVELGLWLTPLTQGCRRDHPVRIRVIQLHEFGFVHTEHEHDLGVIRCGRRGANHVVQERRTRTLVAEMPRCAFGMFQAFGALVEATIPLAVRHVRGATEVVAFLGNPLVRLALTAVAQLVLHPVRTVRLLENSFAVLVLHALKCSDVLASVVHTSLSCRTQLRANGTVSVVDRVTLVLDAGAGSHVARAIRAGTVRIALRVSEVRHRVAVVATRDHTRPIERTIRITGTAERILTAVGCLGNRAGPVVELTRTVRLASLVLNVHTAAAIVAPEVAFTLRILVAVLAVRLVRMQAVQLRASVLRTRVAVVAVFVLRAHDGLAVEHREQVVPSAAEAPDTHLRAAATNILGDAFLHTRLTELERSVFFTRIHAELAELVVRNHVGCGAVQVTGARLVCLAKGTVNAGIHARTSPAFASLVRTRIPIITIPRLRAFVDLADAVFTNAIHTQIFGTRVAVIAIRVRATAIRDALRQTRTAHTYFRSAGVAVVAVL